jgi:hypothetical protein
MCLNFISDAPATIGEIGQAQRAKFRTRGRINLHLNVLLRCNVGENIIDHPGKYLVSNLRSDEVKDQYVIADPIQQLWPVQDNFKMTIYFTTDLALDHAERILSRHVWNAISVRI